MQSPRFRFLFALATLAFTLTPTATGQGQEGFLFDPGVSMENPAAGASTELAQLQKMLGSWTVEVSTPIRGTRELRRQVGHARLTWMNRGHAMMERLYLEASEDTADVHLAAFHAFAPGTSTWGVGEATSETMAVQIFHGAFEEEALLLHRSQTVSGGLGTELQRRTLRFQ
ncbi:MAG: hypothetical protein ACPG31_05740, partial [Planctomycetota bacterium]